MPQLSICTSALGDVDRLRLTYPLNVAAAMDAGADVEMVLVCSAGSEGACVVPGVGEAISSGLLRCFEAGADSAEVMAMNAAMQIARGDIVLYLPSSNVITPRYLQEIVELSGTAQDRRMIIAPRSGPPECTARQAMFRSHFELLGGYDDRIPPSFVGPDLLRRAYRRGLNPIPWSPYHGTCIAPTGSPAASEAMAAQLREAEHLSDQNLAASSCGGSRPHAVASVTPLVALPRPQPATQHRGTGVKLSFGAVIYDESVEQIEWMVAGVRACHPEATIFLISDGLNRDDCRALLSRYTLRYVAGDRLKTPESGALWWHRFFSVALESPFDYLFKLDADTRVCRPFEQFPDLDAFGSWREDHIQGGIQGFTRKAVEALQDSRVGEDPAFRDPASWATTKSARWHLQHFGLASSDYVLMALLRRLALRYGNWPQVDSMFRQTRPFLPEALATHPHKFPTQQRGWRIDRQRRHDPTEVSVGIAAGNAKSHSRNVHRLRQLTDRRCGDGSWVAISDPATAQIDVATVFPQFRPVHSRTFEAELRADVVLLNGLRERRDIRNAIQHWWQRLSPGGVLAGTPYFDGSVNGVAFDAMSAVDEISSQIGMRLRLTLDLPPVWYAVKGDNAVAQGKFKIGIVSACDRRQKSLAEMSVPSRMSYARKHGYELITDHDLVKTASSAHWERLRLLRELLPQFDWLFWSDVDSLVMNQGIPLESLLPSVDDDADMVLTLENMGVANFHVSSGQFAIRRSDWSLRFLDDWLALQADFSGDAVQDQRALIHLIESRDLSRRIRLLPQRHCNSYVGNYREGDFILHFAGIADSEKRRLMSLYAGRAAGASGRS